LVQNRDREAYVCGLLLPKDARRSFFAIRSFNIELASIKDSQHSRNSVHTDNTATSKDSSLALKVRMQWWREALDHIYDGRNVMEHNPSHANDLPNLLAQSYGKNPVVRILQDAVKDKQLTRRFLERLLEAREGDLTVQQPVTEQEMLEYADAIQSSLLYLSLETCGVRDDAADVVAQHTGIGIGLVTALRGARIRLSKSGECPIPVELIETRHLFPYHKLILYDEIEAAKEENQLAPEERQIMQNAVEHVAGLAYYHLQKAQELQADVPKHARTCFLPVIPAMQYLSKLEAANYDLMDDRLLQQGSGYLKTLFLMTRTWLTGVF
jgi:NADH dehydrogenase [ubiquinone] 1 alpha subcomplex assembly factor 6